MRVKTCLFCFRSEFPTKKRIKEIEKSIDIHSEQIWKHPKKSAEDDEHLAIPFRQSYVPNMVLQEYCFFF